MPYVHFYLSWNVNVLLKLLSKKSARNQLCGNSWVKTADTTDTVKASQTLDWFVFLMARVSLTFTYYLMHLSRPLWFEWKFKLSSTLFSTLQTTTEQKSSKSSVLGYSTLAYKRWVHTGKVGYLLLHSWVQHDDIIIEPGKATALMART